MPGKPAITKDAPVRQPGPTSEEGLCKTCGKPVPEGRAFCDDCRDGLKIAQPQSFPPNPNPPVANDSPGR